MQGHFGAAASIARFTPLPSLNVLHNPFSEATPVKAHGGYIRVGPPIRPGDNAYAQVRGYDKGDKTGITYVYANCRTWDDTDLTDLTTHESVHFAGNIGHFDIGGSAAYGTAAFRLSNAQALKNASNYTWLAYLAQLPDSQWLTAT